MFRFYRDCLFQNQNLSEWIAILSVLIAVIALWIAYDNLRAIKRSQRVESHLHLIELENDLRNKWTDLKLSTIDYTNLRILTTDKQIGKEHQQKFLNLATIKDNAFILYISCADKMASLINSENL